jgi:putative nucleotidyltransferase-like protein
VSGGCSQKGGWCPADRYQLLADLLVGRAPATPVDGEARWMELVALARAEGVGPLLHRVLCSRPNVEVPAAASEALAKTYLDEIYASLLRENVRVRLCRRLGQREIPVLLLKGAALACTCYDDPATRPMKDLDLLVPRSRVEQAARCLEEEGFRPLSGSLAAELRRPRGHLVYVHAATRAVVELHGELKLLGRAQTKAVSEIWAGARPAGGDIAARVMRLGHTFPLLCVHMLLQHRDTRLLWLYDLHRVLLAMDGAEAARARDAATRWGVAPCMVLALIRVQALFGTPVPEELSSWAEDIASQHGLQARVAAHALAHESAEAPSEYLISLLMNRNYSRLRILFPTPHDLRQRLGLGAHDRIRPADYAAFLARRLRNGPLHLRQLWRLCHAAPRPRPPRTDVTPPRTGNASPAEKGTHRT